MATHRVLSFRTCVKEHLASTPLFELAPLTALRIAARARATPSRMHIAGAGEPQFALE